MGKKKTNDKDWHALISKEKMLFALRQQDILTWIKPYKIPNEAVIALEEDILEFINRACHAVKLQKELDIQ